MKVTTTKRKKMLRRMSSRWRSSPRLTLPEREEQTVFHCGLTQTIQSSDFLIWHGDQGEETQKR
jgi:hypothetical protein